MSAEIDRLIAEFFSQIKAPQPETERFTLATYRTDWTWPQWGPRHGVYFFEQDGHVRYVGRALRTTLRQRIKDQCSSVGDPSWDSVIGEPDVVVGVVPLPDELWHMAAALEAFLIVALRPTNSKRIS